MKIFKITYIYSIILDIIQSNITFERVNGGISQFISDMDAI